MNMRKIIDNISNKFNEYTGFLSFVVVGTVLFYYGFKFQNQGELTFKQNHFMFYMGFALLVFLGFICCIYQNHDLKKGNVELRKSNIDLASKLEESMSLIQQLLKKIYSDIEKNNDSNVELHHNTRSIMLDIAIKKDKDNTST